MNIVPLDKLLHALAGIVIAALTYPFGILYAVICLFVVAIGKEVYDHFFGGTVDIYDIVATVWAGVVMLGIIELAISYI